MSWTWNESNMQRSVRINWRASLVPAAAAIPAPIPYSKVASRMLGRGPVESFPGTKCDHTAGSCGFLFIILFWQEHSNNVART